MAEIGGADQVGRDRGAVSAAAVGGVAEPALPVGDELLLDGGGEQGVHEGLRFDGRGSGSGSGSGSGEAGVRCAGRSDTVHAAPLR